MMPFVHVAKCGQQIPTGILSWECRRTLWDSAGQMLSGGLRKAAYEACVAAGIDVPKELDAFFGWEAPSNRPGMEVSIADTGAVTAYKDNGRSGFEVDITKLPKDVTVVRFFNAWCDWGVQ